MSKKNTNLPQRPAPPTVVQIIEDMKNAKENDIIFTIQLEKSQVPGTPDTVSEAYSFEEFSPQPKSSGDSTDEASAIDEKSLGVDMIYDKAMQFIEVHNQLKTAPAQLNEDYEVVKTLGAELTDSIKALKDQSDLVLKKSPRKVPSKKS